MRLHRLTVGAVDALTEDSVVVTLEVPPHLRDDYEYAAGQHLVVEREGLRRTYSICAPAGSGVLRVAIKKLPGGAFSTWAHEALQAGDALAVMPPGGRFGPAVDPSHRKRYAAIAAGSGITPILSIVATILEREPGSQVVLVDVNRTVSSIMFLEELEDLKDRHPERFELFHVLSREPRPVETLSGRLDRPRLTRLLDTVLAVEDIDDWYLCGPLDLVAEVRSALDDRDVRAERIHRELFHVDDAPPLAARAVVAAPRRGPLASATIRLDGRESVVDVSATESVLDALLRVRSDAPYACRGGVCGTCRARLVDGRVRMDRSYALEDAEREAGFVLACQAHPLTETITVDFDL
jgi:ring-1,2-phenylacetyl-CoA epoxidase subunit PaaE